MNSPFFSSLFHLHFPSIHYSFYLTLLFAWLLCVLIPLTSSDLIYPNLTMLISVRLIVVVPLDSVSDFHIHRLLDNIFQGMVTYLNSYEDTLYKKKTKMELCPAPLKYLNIFIYAPLKYLNMFFSRFSWLV